MQALSSLAGLLEEDASAISDTKMIDNAWRGAEAYHFYLLAQRQLYDGHIESAFVTSQALTMYEDIIDPKLIYSLIGNLTLPLHPLCVRIPRFPYTILNSLLALVSLNFRQFATASKAFTALEALPGATEKEKNEYADLALDIFIKYVISVTASSALECGLFTLCFARRYSPKDQRPMAFNYLQMNSEYVHTSTPTSSYPTLFPRYAVVLNQVTNVLYLNSSTQEFKEVDMHRVRTRVD